MKRTDTQADEIEQAIVLRETAMDLFSSTAFLIVNKTLLQIYDPNHVIFLSNLIDKYKYFKARGMLKESKGKEWFYMTYKNQEEHIGLSEYQIRQCIETFKEDDVIQTKRKGVPAKNFYFINWSRLILILNGLKLRSNGNTPSTEKTSVQELKKLQYKYLKTLMTSTENIEELYKEIKEGNQNKDNKNSMGDSELFDLDQMTKYSADSQERWNQKQPVDHKSFVEFFNQSTGARCRMSSTKKSDIEKHLKHFSAKEIKKALTNRSKSLEDSEYLTSWESIFSRKVERMEKYLNMDISKAGKRNSKASTGYYEDDYEFREDDEIV